jgi:hypothetical protein
MLKVRRYALAEIREFTRRLFVKTLCVSILSGALLLGVTIAQNSPVPAQSSGEQQPSSAQTPGTAASTPSTSAQSPTQQNGTATTAQSSAVTRIAPGSVIPVSLTKTIDAKKAKAGEEVVAKVTQDMKSTSGEVIVAKDTKVLGHVTEAQARNKEQKESEVGIAFDHAVTKDGRTLTMPMSIQAIVGPQNSAPQNNQSSSAAGEAAPPTQSGNTRAGMGAPSAASQAPSTEGGGMPSDTQSSAPARPPITAQTQGVIGIPGLTLTSTAPNASQGSLLSSDKNNVKIESGTMMLLRVSQ